MNDPTLPGPCAGYEFELVELHEGALGPIDAGRVRAHLESCVRCRDWQARYAALDAALVREPPRNHWKRSRMEWSASHEPSMRFVLAWE